MSLYISRIHGLHYDQHDFRCAGKVASGVGEVSSTFRPYDVIYWIDFIILTVLLSRQKNQVGPSRFEQEWLLRFLHSHFMIFSGNLFVAEANRSELLTRTFSRDYLVKYLGLNAFMVYDGVQTYRQTKCGQKQVPMI